MTGDTTKRKLGKNAFLFVIVTVTLDMMGFGLITPVIPGLLEELSNKPAEEIVVWGGALTATYALMNFLSGPTLGGLSDRFGRRPVLLASIATLALDFIIMGFASSIAVLFIGRALAGISSATFSTANAYIADLTEPAERGRAFGMVGAAFGIGFIVGPALGGLLGEIHIRAPFFAAAGLAAINFLYGLFVLPESLVPENRRPFDLKRSNPFGAFAHFVKVPKVAWFLVTLGIAGFAHSVYPGTWSFFGEIRYGWTPGQIGASLACVGVGSAIVQAILMGKIIKVLGPFKTVALGILVNFLGFLGFALAFEPWMAFVVIPLSSIGGIMNPAISAVNSSLTPKNAQGELQGAAASIMALAMIFAPITMTQTLHAFTKADAAIYFPGAAFLLAAALMALAIIPFYLGFRANREDLVEADPGLEKAET